jgi:hypothetical protein
MFVLGIPLIEVPLSLHAAAFVGGVLSWITLFCYFSALSKEHREPSEVAAWIASTPIWILFAAALLYSAGYNFPSGSLTPLQWFGVLLVTAGLMTLPFFLKSWELVGSARYRIYLGALVVANALYTVLMAATIGELLAIVPASAPLPEFTAALNLMPAFWLGALTGCVVIVPRKEFRAFKANVGNILRNWKAVMLLEIAGTLVFWAEVGALGYIHPAVAALIVGLNPIIVLSFGYLVRQFSAMHAEAFPRPRHATGVVALLACILVGFVFAMG